jgi:acyl-ACP thioesterase
LVLAASSRRPQRVDKLVAAIPHQPQRRATGRSPEKLLPASGVTRPETATCEIDVRHSDLDVNNHANNSRYLGWLLDSYPSEFHHKNQVCSCEVNYLGETADGDKLLVQSQPDGQGLFTHEIANKAGTTVCRARLSWVPLIR